MVNGPLRLSWTVRRHTQHEVFDVHCPTLVKYTTYKGTQYIYDVIVTKALHKLNLHFLAHLRRTPAMITSWMVRLGHHIGGTMMLHYPIGGLRHRRNARHGIAHSVAPANVRPTQRLGALWNLALEAERVLQKLIYGAPFLAFESTIF